jgi:asparaginyl-tRNA synthetase
MILQPHLLKTAMFYTQRIQAILKQPKLNTTIEIYGWLKTRRESKNLSFLEITDGSCLQGLQVIAETSLDNYNSEIKKLTTGVSLRVTGLLRESPAKGQDVELFAHHIEILGWADPATYPLQKKQQSFKFLRTIPHLRGRTNSFGCMMRIRNRLATLIHNFFQEQGFVQLHTPIITTSDCEGAGEMFTVTSFDLDNLPIHQNGLVDYSKDFFSKHAGLTVSGQLEAETYAQALGNVYTFGPTFRAENSNTSRHLAEFWMMEPEMSFCDLEGDMAVAEQMLQFLIQDILETCREDLALFGKFVDRQLFAKLESVLRAPFTRLTYTKAVAILQKSKKKFEYPVEWGIDLQSEHEKYLTDEVCRGPVILTDYPKTIKPFYMRVNDDGKTVAAMDILFPGIGEIIGGSQREERLEQLLKRMDECSINPADYEWYLDLRRFGTVPHAGFGLGFERIVLFVTGLKNIRDVIPFPRTPGTAV